MFSGSANIISLENNMPVVRFRDFEKRAAVWNIKFGQVNRKVPFVKRDCDSVLSSQVILNLRPLLSTCPKNHGLCSFENVFEK